MVTKIFTSSIEKIDVQKLEEYKGKKTILDSDWYYEIVIDDELLTPQVIEWLKDLRKFPGECRGRGGAWLCYNHDIKVKIIGSPIRCRIIVEPRRS